MMKKVSTLVTLLTILALSLGLSATAAEQVVDVAGNPIFPGKEYYIIPAIRGPPGGGVRLGKTGNSECPVTVIQDYSEVKRGIPVKFTIKGISLLEIYTGTPLDISFTKKPNCVESNKWVVFVDDVIKKACVGIGGPLDHPGQQTFAGTFSIESNPSGFGYKLVFCIAGSPTCLDIGRFDAGGEGGRRLILTEHEVFDLVFVEATAFESGINSVV